jgi:hypothetical protein
VSFTTWNAGVSWIFSRTTRPTTSSTALNRNGIRQPQDRNCSSGSAANRLTTDTAIR